MIRTYSVAAYDGLKTTSYRFFDPRRLARWLRQTRWIQRVDRIWEASE